MNVKLWKLEQQDNEKDMSIRKIDTHHRLVGHFSYSDNGADESQARVCH